MWGRTKGSRASRWVLAAAFVGAIVVGMVFGPIVVSAATARTTAPVSASNKVASCHVGTSPEGVAYDPADQEVYVANDGTHNVSVVKAPCTVVATITLPSGSGPDAVAFDPSNNYVYVTGEFSNAVYAIHGTKLVGTITGFDEPDAIAYNPCELDMVVANFASDNLSLVNDLRIGIFSDPVGLGPDGIDYNPVTGLLDVVNFASANVTTVYASGVTNSQSYSVGSEPDAVAYDAAVGCDFIANWGSDNVTELCVGTFGTYTSSFSGFSEPSSVTWSQAKLVLYVANFGSGKLDTVAVTPGQNISVAKGIAGSAYDDANGDIYVGDVTTGILYVYST